MKTYRNKIAKNNTHAPAENTATAQLQDNRPQAAIQKQQVDALADKATIQKQANNTGLPDNLKSGIEDLSGHGMNDVKVHYNSDKPAQLNAHAYAQGTDIHIASGQQKHLPHEAWHVVQQKQGRVKPTMQMKGKVNVNDDDGLEKEADVMGAKALQAKADNTSSLAEKYSSGGIKQFVVQRYENTSHGKLSKNGHLFLHSSGDLYASAQKFKEANSIGGDIAFEKGNGIHVYGKMLYKVLPKRKENAKNMPNLDGTDEQQAKSNVVPNTPTIETLEEEFRSFILDNREEAQESPEKAQEIFGHGIDPHNIQELRQLKEGMAQLAHALIGSLGVPVIERRIAEYLKSQNNNRPLMPSDCRGLARYVAGFDADSRLESEETNEIAAGNVYLYNAENENAEWPFHYAPIIMTDGRDHVTMENAASKVSDKFSKMPFDRSWFFEMYGAEHGQTFYDKYSPDMEKK